MPRAGVTTEKVFAAAVEIANGDGFETVTLARIAEHFGIRTPSLYKHIKNLEEVREHLALRGFQGLRDALWSARTNATNLAEPRDVLREFARAYRRFARENPGLYAASLPTHLLRGPEARETAEQLLEESLAVLRELRFPKTEILSAARSLRSTVHGFVSLELAGGFGLPEELDKSFEFLIEHWLNGVIKDRD